MDDLSPYSTQDSQLVEEARVVLLTRGLDHLELMENIVVRRQQTLYSRTTPWHQRMDWLAGKIQRLL